MPNLAYMRRLIRRAATPALGTPQAPWIDPGDLKDNAVVAGNIAADAVITAKIQDGAVTKPKLAEGLGAMKMAELEFDLSDLGEGANQTREDIDVVDELDLPDGAYIIDAKLSLVEPVLETATPREMEFKLGYAAAGVQFINDQRCDLAEDVVHSIHSGRNEGMVLGATPNANWNVLTQGEWKLQVTYIDYGVLSTE